jgi:outer membrane protein
MKQSGWKIIPAAAAIAASFSAWGEGPQIGFVDMDKIFQESRLGQQSKSELDNEAAGFARELEQLNESARQVQEDLDKNTLTLSDRDRTQRERRIGELRAQFDRKKEAFNEEYGQHRGQAVEALLKLIQRAVAKVADQDQLELVVNRAVMVNGSIDITQKVIRSLDDASSDSGGKK